MNVTVLVAPYRNATLEEQEQTAAMALSELEAGRVPVFLPWALGGLLCDDDEKQRAQALMASRQFCEDVAKAGGRCLVLEGRVTEGMRSDFLGWAAGDPTRARMWHWAVQKAAR